MSAFFHAKETRQLAVCIQTLNAKGGWTSRTRVIHLDPRDQGRFDVVSPQRVTEKPPMLLVEVHLLEEADHAHH